MKKYRKILIFKRLLKANLEKQCDGVSESVSDKASYREALHLKTQQLV